MVEVVNVAAKLASFDEQWSPKIVGQVNDTHIKLAKLKGEFFWHKHDDEDEMFLIVKGSLLIKLRDRDLTVREGEFVIIPRGVEHLPVAEEEVELMLIEPAATVNTGDVRNDRTLDELERI